MVITGAQALTEAAHRSDPEGARCDGLGDSVGHPEFVRSRLATVLAKHDRVRSAVRVDSVALLCSTSAKLHAEGGASTTECGVCWASRCVFATSLQSPRGGTAMQH